MMNGAAYQLLWSVFRVWKTTIQNVTPGPSDLKPEALTLILEPSEGGDLRFGGEVEQIKTRSSGKPWSLEEIIGEVLPDLYKACRGQDPASVYRFVTESPMGSWEDVSISWRSLGERLGRRGDPLSLLDSKEEFKSAASNPALAKKVREIGGGYTEAGIFLYIAHVLREGSTNSGKKKGKKRGFEDSPEVMNKNLYRLLAGFEFDGGRLESVIKGEVLAELSARGVKEYELEEKLGSLVESLLQHARRGEAIVSRDSFLVQHRLQGIRDLRRWDLIVRQSQSVLRDHLSRHRYKQEEESRESRSLLRLLQSDLEGRPVVAWGESGQGKSWLFYWTAHELVQHDNVVLVLDSTQDVLRDRHEAARLFCEKIWGTDEQLSFDRLAQRVRSTMSDFTDGIWLTLLIDGVKEPGYLEEFSTQEWAAIGIRVAVAFTSDRDESDFLVGELASYQVRDFSHSELRRYLRLCLGENTLLPPHDVQQFLKRPLMARLYCDHVAKDGRWQPKNEYQLIEGYWTGQASYSPVATDAIIELASLIPEGEAYPWPIARLRAVGIGELDLRLLRKTRLVRLAGGDRLLEVWHDRLLQWAIAEGLVSGMRARRLTSEDVQERVRVCLEGERASRHFGYVPMDVLWLLADPKSPRDGDVQELLQLFERIEEPLDLVPSLGARIVPHLFSRLRNICGSSNFAEIRYLQFLEKLVDPSISSLAVELLNEDSVVLQKAAARLLASQGSPDALDRLWDLYRDWSRRMNVNDAVRVPFGTVPETEEIDFGDVVQLDEALARCVQLGADWLEQAILNSNPERDPVHTLIFLIPKVARGGEVWLRVKKAAFEKVRHDYQRCLAVCIANFRDLEELSWLKVRVDVKEDMLGSMVRKALYILAPEEDLYPIDPDTSLDLALGRSWWLRPLQMEYPRQTSKLLFETIRRAENPWISASFFDGRENLISEELLDFLLDTTSGLLAKELSSPGPDKRLYRPFSKLEDISRSGLLRVFWKHRGTRLEERLTSWLIREGPTNDRGRRLTPEAGLAVLRKIAGQGMAEVANSFLELATTYWGRDEAFDLALRASDDNTIKLLSRIAFMDEEHPIVSQASRTVPLDQRAALRVLADLGHDDIVIRGLIRWGLHLPPDFAEYLGGRVWDDDQLAPAFEALAFEPIPPGAILALGMSKRPEMVARVLSVLNRVDPVSSQALACLLALEMLEDQSEATEQAFGRALDVPDHRNIARRALAWLKRQRTIQGEETRIDEARQIWQRRHDRLFLLDKGEELEHLSLLSDVDEVREFLDDLAFSEGAPRLNPSALFGAIRALRMLDSGSAFEAGVFQIERGLDNYRREYPKLLLEIDPVRAEQVLGDLLKRSDDFNVMYAIGEALDRTSQQLILIRWLEDPDPTICEGACFAAEAMRWSVDLDNALFAIRRAADWDVREAAWAALERLRLQKEVDHLVEAFHQEEDRARRWALLDAALALGHPGVIEGYGQFGWFAQLNRQRLPYSMKKHALEKLEERRQMLIKELEYRKRE